MEREERWIEILRRSLQHADEPLPAGGWEALERDLAAAARRRRVFDPLWRRIAAAVAVVAVAVLIGETVVNREAVDGARMPEMIAEELPTPDGNLLYNKVCPRRGGESPESQPVASAALAQRPAPVNRLPKVAAKVCAVQTGCGRCRSLQRTGARRCDGLRPGRSRGRGGTGFGDRRRRRRGRLPAGGHRSVRHARSGRSARCGTRRWGSMLPDCPRRSMCRRGGLRRWDRLPTSSVRAAFSA